MNFKKFIKKSVKCIEFAFTAALITGAVQAQSAGGNTSMLLAGSNNLYCAGYVQHGPINVNNKIIGAQEEQDGFMYAEGDVIYINANLQEGQKYTVVRPRGRVKSRWSNKGDLGIYMQEVGAVEVFKARSNYSVARIVTSCDNFTLGDIIMPWQERTSPVVNNVPFEQFADPNGKAIGRLVMARDNQELITRDQIVFVDLGRDNNVQAGDKLTIFRPLGKGNLHRGPGEAVSARSYGYKSMTNPGGGFSNQAPRKRGENARGKVETHRDAKRGRPDIRKIVGEGVILNVKEKVATVVITRTAQEIQTGDFVEVQ